MKKWLYRILNIKLSESRYVFDLLAVQFMMGLASAFINIISFTFFIYNFSATKLPYAFLGIAGLLLLLNLVYEKLEHRFSAPQLLKIIIGCSIVVLALFWSGLAFTSGKALIFALLIWNTLFYMLTSYAFWGLVSLLFNVRESKRIFSIVGSGDIPAKLIGYLSAPVLISLIGLNHLLLVAIAALGGSFIMLLKLLNVKRWGAVMKKTKVHHHEEHAHVHKVKKSRLEHFFTNELIFSISVLSVLSYNVFVLVDYTFITQVKAKVYDAVGLASFIATFFAFGRITALLLKLAFSSRMIERLGIIRCLLITPVTLFLFSLVFFNTHDPAMNVYIFGIMALLTEVLRSTIQEPVFLILFQPLNEHLRLKGHMIAKGYMFPLALVIVSLSLIIFPIAGIELTILNTIKILLINLCIWAVVIFLIKKAYIKVLHQSIRRGVYSGEAIQVYDQKTIDILLNKISHGKENEVIYALRLLEGAGYPNLKALLEEQLTRDSKEVKKYVLNRLEEQPQIHTELLKTVFESEQSTEVKEKIVTILCKLDASFLYSIAERITEQDPQTRKVIISHLLNQSEFNYLFKAGQEINRLVESPRPSERLLALDIISELNNIRFTHAIESLIQDEHSEVRRSAVIAACRLKIRKFLPALFEMLSEVSTKYLALHGLTQYGDQLFEDILLEDMATVQVHSINLIKVAGRIKGPHSTAFLLSRLTPETPEKERIINALWSKGFTADSQKDVKHFRSLLHLHLKTGTDKIFYYNEVPNFNGHQLIRSSIASEVKNDLVTSLKLCAMLWRRKEVERILELVEDIRNNKLFNAMEMIEMVLPKKIALQINSLIDFVLDPSHIRRPFISYDTRTFFTKVVVTHNNVFNVWTKAVCIYCSLKTGQVEFMNSLPNQKELTDYPILKETRAFVLNTIH